MLAQAYFIPRPAPRGEFGDNLSVRFLWVRTLFQHSHTQKDLRWLVMNNLFGTSRTGPDNPFDRYRNLFVFCLLASRVTGPNC